jgi:shikimate dehydrogenase
MQLEANKTRIRGARVKILGAGGAAPAIVSALLKNGAAFVTIYNRTLEKAEKIAAMSDNVTAYPLDAFTADRCQILINTTSVGLDSYDCPTDTLDGIAPNTAVYDIIYSPPVTRFMQMALDRGLAAHNGYDMLVYQGLLADRIWFGKEITL